MVFIRNQAKCPFCGSVQFEVNFLVNDMPMNNDPSLLEKRMRLTCGQCGETAFEVISTQGKQISAIGVSICKKCEDDFFNASGRRWREEDIPKITYPVDTELCPRCGSQLSQCWWRGWNYEI